MSLQLPVFAIALQNYAVTDTTLLKQQTSSHTSLSLAFVCPAEFCFGEVRRQAE